MALRKGLFGCSSSRRDGAIVAWHEVPGTAPPQESRPVGYGVIRAGVRTDLMIGVTKFRTQKPKKFMLYCFRSTIRFLSMANTFSCLNIHCVFSTKERVWVLNPDIRERLWPHMGGIAKQNGMIPKCIGGVSDHVHLLVTLPTRLAVAKAVQFDKGRIIGLDSSDLSKPPKLCLATGLWRIQRWYLAGSGNGPLHRAAARTSSDTNLSRRVFSLP